MCCLSPGIARVPILYHSLQFSTVLYGCGKEYHCGSVENIKENQMRPCCARRSVLSSSLMVLFEIFDPYGEQFLETSTEKTALQLPKKQPWTRLMHKQIYLSLWQYFSQNVQSVQYISVHAEEKDSGYDHGGCIELLYNRISFSKTQKVIWLKMKSTNQNPSASEYRLWVNQGADEAPANHHNGSFTCACGFPLG